MLPLTASIYIDTIKNDDSKQLNVAIHRSIQRKPAQDVFAQMMADTKPTTMEYNSKWGVNDVVSFQVGYEAAVNKGEYLKPFTKDIKPSIIRQHQVFVADFLNDSDLVIKGGTEGEEKTALGAFNSTVQVVKF